MNFDTIEGFSQEDIELLFDEETLAWRCSCTTSVATPGCSLRSRVGYTDTKHCHAFWSNGEAWVNPNNRNFFSSDVQSHCAYLCGTKGCNRSYSCDWWSAGSNASSCEGF